MDAAEKVEQLKNIIVNSLSSLVTQDYYLLEVPYYTNIGDTLIWQGELDFLKRFPYKCKGMFSLETFKNTKQSIEEDSLILFQGGGNFGDLWTKHHDFKMSIMERYSSCRFLFFPQTVYFQNEENLSKCADFMSRFSNVTICARDTTSYDILKGRFKNSILLVPDMAFCMDMKNWTKEYSASNPLFLKRADSEFKQSEHLDSIERLPNIDVTDWPTMRKEKDLLTRWMLRLRDGRLKKLGLADVFVKYIYRSYLIRTGVKLLNTHTQIYTTRLHAAILGILLSRDVIFLDNSYGKNSSFYDTWLRDCEQIKMLS